MTALDLTLPWIDRIRRQHIGNPSNLGPIRQRWASIRSSSMMATLSSRLTNQIDIIQVEHPWGIRIASDLRSTDRCRKSRIIYSAHNVEHQLYRDIWMQAGHWNAAAKRIQRDILSAEQECAQTADLIWTVSEHDASIYRDLGAKRVIVVPNGCRDLPPPQVLPEIPSLPYLLFIGGDYAPNIDGFLTWLGDEFKFLPSDTCLAIAGTAGNRLASNSKIAEAVHRRQLINFGRTSQKILDQLVLHAHGILVPMGVGGGTNLKTAEALCSKRPILTSPFGIRGYEDWKNANGVYISDTPENFQRSARIILEQPFVDHCKRDTTKLRWAQILDNAIADSL